MEDNLHSNMVRFIICPKTKKKLTVFIIYIPIWLDLLYKTNTRRRIMKSYLHSNMVRFIIYVYKRINI